MKKKINILFMLILLVNISVLGQESTFVACEYCGADNNTSSTNCVECGAPLPVKTAEKKQNNEISQGFPIEGINDIKGLYENADKTESWAIYFDEGENEFVAYHCYLKGDNEDCEDPIVIAEVTKNSFPDSYNVAMRGISGEMVPQWNMVYNKEKGYYDLHTTSYDIEKYEWIDTVFNGNEDNG